MISRTIVIALLVMGLAQAASAEETGANTSTLSNSTTHEALPQELRQKLEQAGYKNVEIVPGSYLVNAEDSQGNKVMMRIGPTSMTVLTEASADSSSTTGSGSNNNESHEKSSAGTSSSNNSGTDLNTSGSTK